MRFRLSPASRLGIACAVLLTTSTLAAEVPQAPAPVRVSLAEAKRMARLMNDIYISAVLTTHKMYVQDPGTPSAVTWAKQVSRQVAGRGWPAAHIFSATDRPLNPENAMADSFERDAVDAFKHGKTTYERTEPDALRYATSISVVDKSCLMCHVRNHEGDLLGGVSYRVLLTRGAGSAGTR